jgi:ABC-2 type transport system ATP-binding protein
LTRFAAANYLSFESDEAEVASIRMLPGVERVEREDRTVRVHSASLQDTSLHLFQLANEKKWRIEAFRFEVGSLDDLFVYLLEEGWSDDSAGAPSFDGNQAVLS